MHGGDAKARRPAVNGPLAKSHVGTLIPKRDAGHPETGRCKVTGIARVAMARTCPMKTNKQKTPTGAGAIIALLILAGTIGGGLLGQPSIGLLAGTGAGIVIALLIWLKERGR